MSQNAIFYEHIRHVLGGDPSLGEAEILRLAADWFSAAHAWQFLRRPIFVDLRGAIDISDATYTHSARRLTKTGAFTNYTYVAGDLFKATDGTGVTARHYPIAEREDANAIILSGDGLGSAANGSANVDGRLPNASVALPSDFMAFVGQRPLRSTSSTVRSIAFTSPEVLTARRASQVDTDGSGAFLGAISELVNRETELTDPVLELFPEVSANEADAFRGYYRARLVIDPSSDQNVVPLPAGRPALELALIKACRAFALGLEEGEEVGKPTLEELQEQLVASQTWAAAKKQDGLQQPTVGPMRGGVGQRLRTWGRRMLANEVEGPS